MAFAPSSPVTGGAQTGFTSPTYTLTATNAPEANGKAWAVTALGGTQTGVTVHSVSSPFDVLFVVPKVAKQLPSANPTTGVVPSVPINSYMLKIRKSGTPAANQSERVITARLVFDVPAGVDFYDSAEVRGIMSLLAGLCSQQSAGIGDTLVTGIP